MTIVLVKILVYNAWNEKYTILIFYFDFANFLLHVLA
jgi:hypothetical protein